MSYGDSRRSNAIDVLSAWNVGSCGSEKRDMGAGSLGAESDPVPPRSRPPGWRA